MKYLTNPLIVEETHFHLIFYSSKLDTKCIVMLKYLTALCCVHGIYFNLSFHQLSYLLGKTYERRKRTQEKSIKSGGRESL